MATIAAKKRTRRAPAAAAAAAAAVATSVAPQEDPFINFKGSLEKLVYQLETNVKERLLVQQTTQENEEDLTLTFAQQMEELEAKHVEDLEALKATHEAHVEDLKQAFQEQEAENNGSFIKTIETLEGTIQTLEGTFKERVEAEIKSYMDVSLLNSYLRQIDDLKNDNDILARKLATKHKILEKIQRDHKELQFDLASIRSSEEVDEDAEAEAEAEEAEEAEEEAEEEAGEAEAEAEADVAEEEEAEVAEEEAEADADADANAEEEEEEEEEEKEEKEEIEVEVEIDVSKLDIIEVDEKEYYLDLDNNILDKDTLDIVGTLTPDGDANFN